MRTRVRRILAAVAVALSLILGGAGIAAAAPPPVDPTPPPTSAADAAARNAAAGLAVSVQSVSKRADGSVDVRTYDPAEGISESQLVGMLHRHGDAGAFTTTDSTAVTAAKALGEYKGKSFAPRAGGYEDNCSFGTTARTFTCPVSFWQNMGLYHPNVRFNDHSTSTWPTDLAVANWNRAEGIDSTYIYNNCPYKAGARCVDVNSNNFGADGYAGYSSLHWKAGQSGAFAEQGNFVNLNDYYDPNLHSHTVAHELGHVLGLGHSPSRADLMYQQNLQGAPEVGSADDFGQLQQLYSVPR